VTYVTFRADYCVIKSGRSPAWACLLRAQQPSHGLRKSARCIFVPIHRLGRERHDGDAAQFVDPPHASTGDGGARCSGARTLLPHRLEWRSAPSFSTASCRAQASTAIRSYPASSSGPAARAARMVAAISATASILSILSYLFGSWALFTWNVNCEGEAKPASMVSKRGRKLQSGPGAGCPHAGA
jgi:hypothetical protein